ncbi:hypothetical protein K435DRAFT_676063 [Dendrothele bispora CBS 962.96]|uniref:Uncharacterized protein n=1 Tax=Dendrothele bispora (strain CBS 962.96) TaxID=1314807 RepID=A0A4S8LMH7_DENBC|nr:hypothetical protein K435DRAFT_676063 [Dendrothele bispora CBS 962.96]
MPEHWKLDREDRPLLVQLLFRLLCVIAHGHTDIECLWAICSTGEPEFIIQKDRLTARISTITVVAGLLLSVTTAFITTVPPVPQVINYTERGPFLCLLLSFGLNLGGLVVGSALLWAIAKAKIQWFCNVMMGSASRVFWTQVMMAYPFGAIGLATVLEAFGLIAAAIASKDPLVCFGSLVLLFFPTSLALIFLWIHRPWIKNETRNLFRRRRGQLQQSTDSITQQVDPYQRCCGIGARLESSMV